MRPRLDGPFVYRHDEHRYTVCGEDVPAISTLLREAGHCSAVGPWLQPKHRERGRQVHAACLALDLGVRPDLPDEHLGYLDAYRKFAATLRPKPTWDHMEEPLVERRLGYAGTPDRVGFMRGRAVLEIKTGGRDRWHGVQLAAQDILCGGPRRRRVAVYLSKTGQFTLHEYEDAADYVAFLEAVDEYHTKHAA